MASFILREKLQNRVLKNSSLQETTSQPGLNSCQLLRPPGGAQDTGTPAAGCYVLVNMTLLDFMLSFPYSGTVPPLGRGKDYTLLVSSREEASYSLLQHITADNSRSGVALHPKKSFETSPMESFSDSCDSNRQGAQVEQYAFFRLT